MVEKRKRTMGVPPAAHVAEYIILCLGLTKVYFMEQPSLFWPLTRCPARPRWLRVVPRGVVEMKLRRTVSDKSTLRGDKELLRLPRPAAAIEARAMRDPLCLFFPSPPSGTRQPTQSRQAIDTEKSRVVARLRLTQNTPTPLGRTRWDDSNESRDAALIGRESFTGWSRNTARRESGQLFDGRGRGRGVVGYWGKRRGVLGWTLPNLSFLGSLAVALLAGTWGAWNPTVRECGWHGMSLGDRGKRVSSLQKQPLLAGIVCDSFLPSSLHEPGQLCIASHHASPRTTPPKQLPRGYLPGLFTQRVDATVLCPVPWSPRSRRQSLVHCRPTIRVFWN